MIGEIKLKFSKSIYYEILIFLFFALLSLLFFFPAISTGKSYIYQDIEANFVPYQILKKTMAAEGHINLWNPHVFSGCPYQAVMHNGPTIFYPFSFVYYLFPIQTAIVWQFVIHFTLAGYFMYLFGRYGLGSRKIISVTGGVAFAFSGFFITHVIHTFIIAGCWLPLIFLCLKLSMERKSVGYCLAGGMVMCFLFLSGLIQVIYYIFCGLALFWLWMTIEVFRDRASMKKDRLFILLSFPLMIAAGVLLGGIISKRSGQGKD